MKYGFTNAFSQLIKRFTKGIELFVNIRCSGNPLCVKSTFDTLIQFFLEKSFVNTVQFCSCKFWLDSGLQ